MPKEANGNMLAVSYSFHRSDFAAVFLCSYIFFRILQNLAIFRHVVLRFNWNALTASVFALHQAQPADTAGNGAGRGYDHHAGDKPTVAQYAAAVRDSGDGQAETPEADHRRLNNGRLPRWPD